MSKGRVLNEARALAGLIEVCQRGVARPATANDVLELTSTPRYLLKGPDGRYVGKGGRGWTEKQRKALIIDDLALAREMRREGRDDYGIRVKIIRLRRKGTAGLEAARLRRDLKVSVQDGTIAFQLSPEDAMTFLSALDGATEDGSVH
jgi:hypothetical protein